MPNLKFKQLLLISNSTKSANQFDFDDRLTLVTANDNSVGKSTLAKMIFWSFGCDPYLDSTWENLDCQSILRFSVGDRQYEVMRYKNLISLNENDVIQTYTKITGEYSERIAQVLQFHALLPKRQQNILETPPPAYYFIPFYIDQKRSWSTAWDNFSNLFQYDSWKATIIKYHIGLLPPKHFELELEKFVKKEEQRLLDVEINKINTALEVVKDFIPKTTATIEISKLNGMTEEIKNDLKKLSDDQEQLLDELTKSEADKSFLLHQKEIAYHIVQELDKDYKFAVENIAEDYIECPLCGTNHENSIVNRTSIMTDKQQAENQLAEISASLELQVSRLEKLNVQLENTRNRIAAIQAKYVIDEEDQKIGLTDIIETIAGNSIQEKVVQSKGQKELKVKTIEGDLKDLTKQQKDLLTSEEKQRIFTAFEATLVSYIQSLNAESVNIANIKSPMDYSKIVREGGAADGTRAILAYYLTIYTLIQQFGSEVVAPIVIDTPNQQEQSLTNYDRILNLVTSKLPGDSQIILCSLNSERLEPIKQNAKVILLDKNKLLNKEKYEEVEKSFLIYRMA